MLKNTNSQTVEEAYIDVLRFCPFPSYPYYKAKEHLPEEQTKFFAAQIVLAFEVL